MSKSATDDPGVESAHPQLPEQPLMLDLGASVFDESYAGRSTLLSSDFAHQADLQPDTGQGRKVRQAGLDDVGHRIRSAENIQDIDRCFDVRDRCDDRFSEQDRADVARIDGDHAKPSPPKVSCDEMAGPYGIRRHADAGDRARQRQKVAQARIVGCMVHADI